MSTRGPRPAGSGAPWHPLFRGRPGQLRSRSHGYYSADSMASDDQVPATRDRPIITGCHDDPMMIPGRRGCGVRARVRVRAQRQPLLPAGLGQSSTTGHRDCRRGTFRQTSPWHSWKRATSCSARHTGPAVPAPYSHGTKN